MIVVANLAEFGPTSDLATTEAVKRLRVEPDAWVFESTNPRYDPIRIPRAESAHPILGIMIGKLA